MENIKASHGFRKKIKEQLPLWQQQGFVSGEQAQGLTAYYRLDTLKNEITHLTLTGVYLIGVFLIGVGVISFIAAHWTALGKEIKVAMIVTAMLAAHGTGYYLWHVSGRCPKLGHALVVLGTLIFGANIGLMAQIFHVHENLANGYLAWSLGAAAVAYVLPSVPNSLIAIVTAMIYFFIGAFDGTTLSQLWFPFALAAVFIPLAYRCRSRWTLWAVLIAMGLSTTFVFNAVEGNLVGNLILPVFVGVAFSAWGLLNEETPAAASFGPPCKSAGFVLCFFFLYLMSFWELATDLQREYGQFLAAKWTALAAAGTMGLIAIVLSAVVLIVRGGEASRKSNLVLLTVAAIAVAVAAWKDAFLLVVIVHIALMLLSANLIRISVQTQNRGLFWAGIWLPGLIILSRTLEYDTELLIKAVVFAACGIGVIVAGVMFERQLKQKGVDHV